MALYNNDLRVSDLRRILDKYDDDDYVELKAELSDDEANAYLYIDNDEILQAWDS